MNKVTAASMLLVLQKGAQRSLGLVSTLILARLLTPDDFGIIAIAMLVLWFVQTLSQAGTEIYILQKEIITNEEVNSAWTLDLLLKNLSFLMIIVFAPVVGSYQDNMSLIFVVLAIGTVLPITALKNPGLWILKREQSYMAIVKMTVLTKLAGLFVTIPLALYFQNFWAIVAGQVLSSVLRTIFSYYISEYRPKPSFSHIGTQWKFSKWLIPQSVLGYFRNHIDTIIVSNIFLPSDLGAYNNLKYFSSIPMLQVMTPLVAPLHVEMGKVQNNINEMKFQSYITIKLMSFMAANFASISFVASEQIIIIFLGEQWVSYHQVFAYLGLMIIPFILYTQASRILMVRQATKEIFIYEIIFILITALFLILMPITSVEDFARYRILSEFLMSLLFYCYATKKSFGEIRFHNVFFLLSPTLLTTLILIFFKSRFMFDWHPVEQLLVLGSSTLIINSILLFSWYNLFASHREKKAIRKFSPINMQKKLDCRL